MDKSTNHKKFTVKCSSQYDKTVLEKMKKKLLIEIKILIEACYKESHTCKRYSLVNDFIMNLVHDLSVEGQCLFSLTCNGQLIDLFEALLASNTHIKERTNEYGCIPLIEAMCIGSVNFVNFLISIGSEVDECSHIGSTPLMFACSKNNVEIIKVLLRHGANVEHHNAFGLTPLIEAIRCKHVEVAKVLIEHGATVYTPCIKFNPLLLASDNLEMVRLLLDVGPNNEYKKMNMYSALVDASSQGNIEVARFLLDSGSEVHMLLEYFETPLKAAARKGHVELACLLVSYGADITEATDCHDNNVVVGTMLEGYKNYAQFIRKVKLLEIIGTGTEQSVNQIPGTQLQSSIPQTAESTTDDIKDPISTLSAMKKAIEWLTQKTN